MIEFRNKREGKVCVIWTRVSTKYQEDNGGNDGHVEGETSISETKQVFGAEGPVDYHKEKEENRYAHKIKYLARHFQQADRQGRRFNFHIAFSIFLSLQAV